jgi:serine phosphatase RsbU (regulator of sigma subunit)
VAVRYAAAAEHARVGGDWYDGIRTRDGALVLTIGDCVGHDQAAAAAMASVRNLMRSTAYLLGSSPAAVLSALEQQLQGLAVDALATAVLARVESTGDDDAPAAGHRLVWCNAGHLPPLLRRADGTVATLDTDPDVLLGLDTDTERVDHTVALPDGATLVLYTDGLTERRGEDSDVGVARLASLLAELGDLAVEALCDELLLRLTPPGGAEDDIALLVLRVHPHEGGTGGVRRRRRPR